MVDASAPTLFDGFGLAEPILAALAELGYETPTPVQSQVIGPFLAGKDIVGLAHTGTGKTAAFALPSLSRLDLEQRPPQVLVLTPTRELCIQVAEAYLRYAGQLRGFRVLPVYGGVDYRGQTRRLQQGVHVVVATPGRLMDHMRRSSIDLSGLTTVVLDEADEMLRMGFIDDVEWILEQAPAERQTSLFSATLPAPVRRIAGRFLNDPVEVSVQGEQRTAATVRQRYWLVERLHKLDALTRLLETEPTDGVLVFVRTRAETENLNHRLAARGHLCAALNGDIPQQQREQVFEQFRSGAFDVLVATDVAARGLDVERISHVINYDIPFDPAAYVHRVGRTGRAGRTGEAILFVSRRERGMLRALEGATGQRFERMDVPSAAELGAHRRERFLERLRELLASEQDFSGFETLIATFLGDAEDSPERVAAALAVMAASDRNLFPEERSDSRSAPAAERSAPPPAPRPPRSPRPRPERAPMATFEPNEPVELEWYRLEVGREHGVQAGNIVGAITNEAGLASHHIGRIRFFDDYALVELPALPRELLEHLSTVRVAGQQLGIRPRRVDQDSRGQGNSQEGFRPRGQRRDSGGRPGPSRSADGPGRAGARRGRGNEGPGRGRDDHDPDRRGRRNDDRDFRGQRGGGNDRRFGGPPRTNERSYGGNPRGDDRRFGGPPRANERSYGGNPRGDERRFGGPPRADERSSGGNRGGNDRRFGGPPRGERERPPAGQWRDRDDRDGGRPRAQNSGRGFGGQRRGGDARGAPGADRSRGFRGPPRGAGDRSFDRRRPRRDGPEAGSDRRTDRGPYRGPGKTPGGRRRDD